MRERKTSIPAPAYQRIEDTESTARSQRRKLEAGPAYSSNQPPKADGHGSHQREERPAHRAARLHRGVGRRVRGRVPRRVPRRVPVRESLCEPEDAALDLGRRDGLDARGGGDVQLQRLVFADSGGGEKKAR